MRTYRMQSLFVVVIAVIAVSLAGSASAAVYTWTGGESGDWNNTANWNGGAATFPNSGTDQAIFDVTNIDGIGTDTTGTINAIVNGANVSVGTITRVSGIGVADTVVLSGSGGTLTWGDGTTAVGSITGGGANDVLRIDGTLPITLNGDFSASNGSSGSLGPHIRLYSDITETGGSRNMTFVGMDGSTGLERYIFLNGDNVGVTGNWTFDGGGFGTEGGAFHVNQFGTNGVGGTVVFNEPNTIQRKEYGAGWTRDFTVNTSGATDMLMTSDLGNEVTMLGTVRFGARAITGGAQTFTTAFTAGATGPATLDVGRNLYGTGGYTITINGVIDLAHTFDGTLRYYENTSDTPGSASVGGGSGAIMLDNAGRTLNVLSEFHDAVLTLNNITGGGAASSSTLSWGGNNGLTSGAVITNVLGGTASSYFGTIAVAPSGGSDDSMVIISSSDANTGNAVFQLDSSSTLRLDTTDARSIAGGLTGNGTVNVGATSGSGTLTMLGTLAPGTSAGTTYIVGDFVFGAGSVYTWEVGDLLDVTGELSADGSWTLNGPDLLGSFTIATTDAGVLQSALDNGKVTGFSGKGYLSIIGNDLVLTVVPEPSTALLLGVGFLAIRYFRRLRRGEG